MFYQNKKVYTSKYHVYIYNMCAYVLKCFLSIYKNMTAKHFS